MQDSKAAPNHESMETLHGRLFNKSNNVYHLPFDREEWERLNKSHELTVLGMGDIYPCPELVQAVLAPVEGTSPKQVLDAGCGTGIWSLEMASRFPHVQVKGIDMSPLPPLPSSPPNFSFEIQDLNDDLSRYHNLFDLVFMKNVTMGIKDIDKTLRELELCLKPGGLLIVIDPDYIVREDKEQYMKIAKLDGDNSASLDSDGSWLSRMVMEITDAAFINGKRRNGTHVVLDYGPWDHALCDPAWSASGSIHGPVGPWVKGSTQEETQMLKQLGQNGRDLLIEWNKTVHPYLLSYGLDQETLNHWSKNTDKELLETKHKMWLRNRFFWTRRRQGEGLPAPPIVGQAAIDASANSMRPTPTTTMEIYYSKEETLARTKKRWEPFHDRPVLAVEKAWKGKQKMS